MVSIIIILGIVFFLAFLANKLNKGGEGPIETFYDKLANNVCGTENDEGMTGENEVAKPDTLGLMLTTLNQLGCQPQTNEDGSLLVKYQGETFNMEFGGMYARVWDPMWAAVKADDPELPKIREAVNAANFNFGPTIVLTAPNDEGVIGFHSRRDIMLHPACPDNVPFVKAVLDSFFDAKQQLHSSFRQINAKQMEAQKNRRPVGFTTNSTSNE